MEFHKKMSFSADLNFWIESVCLVSEGKEFHIGGGLQKKMSDAQMSLFAVYGYIKFYCQKKSVDFFWLCTLRINQTSK